MARCVRGASDWQPTCKCVNNNKALFLQGFMFLNDFERY
jgi:hypothetical protein